MMATVMKPLCTSRSNRAHISTIPSRIQAACNIYVSAAPPSNGDKQQRMMLKQLLRETQSECQKRTEEDDDAAICVVHAFADTSYQRTSFHLAGELGSLVQVASDLVTRAMEALSTLPVVEETAAATTTHPTVGLVDHISILPLGSSGRTMTWTQDEWSSYRNTSTPPVSTSCEEDHVEEKINVVVSHTPIGWTARSVGRQLMHKFPNLTVHYYGDAHPQELPLATVRREQTNFFVPNDSDVTRAERREGSTFRKDTTIVGAPPRFVENYNVRLHSSCSQSKARQLSRRLRSKDGGLPHVEALTLPYSKNRFEVACNLLYPPSTSNQPDDNENKHKQEAPTSCRDIQALVDSWQYSAEHVETSYRVGTTEQQCYEALQRYCQSTERRQQHDRQVQELFLRYLNNH